MKKLILPLLFVSVLFSCKKAEKKVTEKPETKVEKAITQSSKSTKTVQSYKAEDGSLYTITYTFEKNQPVANVTTKDFSVTLNQEQAWAKGAEYKKGDFKLISKGDNIQFFMKDKEITLTLQ